MVYPVAAGQINLGSDGTIQYSPARYAPDFALALYPMMFLSEIANTNFQGTLRDFGDKVIIRRRPTVTTFRTSKGMKLPVQKLTGPAVVELLIDQGVGFNVALEKVDEKQSDLNLSSAIMEEAAIQTKIDIETDFLANIYTSAHADNIGTTAGAKTGSYNIGVAGNPVAVDHTNATTYLQRFAAILSEANVSPIGRWAVIPNWYAYLLGLSDLKNASLTGASDNVLLTGRLPQKVAGFTLYETNLYTPTDDGHQAYPVTFGHKDFITFANQLNELETIPNPESFGRLLRGQSIYGYEAIVPEGLGYGWMYQNEA
jgi:hypothetical protein